MPSARDSYSSVMELPHSTPADLLAATSAEVAPSASGELWHIHGKVYDLTSFVKRHPGGPQVLMSVRGTDDLTAIFESSHAFADRRRVDATMSKYCLGRCAKSQLAFPEGGFYATVTKRVRAALTNGVHANRWWCLKAFILVAAWLSCLCVAFIAPPAAISGSGRCLAAAAAGHLFICHGFVIMHDASHSAVSSNHAINSALSWMWNACACKCSVLSAQCSVLSAQCSVLSAQFDTCMHACMHGYMHAHMRAYTHAYIHAYTHSYAWRRLGRTAVA